jgi:hypothetical protein
MTEDKANFLYSDKCDAVIGYSALLSLAFLANWTPGTITIWKDRIIVSQKLLWFNVSVELQKKDIDSIRRYRPFIVAGPMPGIRILHHNKKAWQFVVASLYVDFEKGGKAIKALRDAGYPLSF